MPSSIISVGKGPHTSFAQVHRCRKSMKTNTACALFLSHPLALSFLTVSHCHLTLENEPIPVSHRLSSIGLSCLYAWQYVNGHSSHCNSTPGPYCSHMCFFACHWSAKVWTEYVSMTILKLSYRVMGGWVVYRLCDSGVGGVNKVHTRKWIHDRIWDTTI